MNEKMIAKLEAKGFNRWTKGNMDRLYINAQAMGLTVSYHKTGSVAEAYWNGERISNAEGRRMMSAKTYIDLKDGALHSDNYWNDDLKNAAQALIDEVTAEIEAEEKAEAEKVQAEKIENKENEMESEKWYAVQMKSSDDWDNGSADFEEAKAMLKKQGCGLIAVIEDDVCEEEIKFDDLFDLDADYTDEELADIVGNADKWDRPGVMDAMNELCERAGRKLRDMVKAGDDCAEIFDALRHTVEDSDEYFDGTPDASSDASDMIDWLRGGGEQADELQLAYVIQNILGVSLV